MDLGKNAPGPRPPPTGTNYPFQNHGGAHEASCPILVKGDICEIKIHFLESRGSLGWLVAIHFFRFLDSRGSLGRLAHHTFFRFPVTL